MYLVCLSNNVQAYETREAAVLVAKDLSDESTGAINVLADDFREQLSYQNGELVQYVRELRPGKQVV